MSDLRLTGAQDLDLAGDRASLVTGADAVAQKIGVRLRLFRGEWFLDERVGVPYYEQVLVKNPNLVAIRSLFRRAIATTPGVEEVTSLDLTVDTAQRRAEVSFRARANDGEIIEGREEFIL